MSDRKAIYITGGGSGIGRAVALHFAERGWFVGLGDIDKTGLHETAELIGNGFVYTHLHDVRDRTAWDEALEAFSVATGGRIDVLFNNAGIPLGGSLIGCPSRRALQPPHSIAQRDHHAQPQGAGRHKELVGQAK